MSLPPEALRSPAQVAAPAGLDNLAVRPGLFVGRTSELDRLDAALATPGGALVYAVHGLGGIGKSTWPRTGPPPAPTAAPPIRWITADTPDGVQQGLADLAGALQPALTGALPIEALAEWTLQWLASHTGWLLIRDNVNDPANIAPLLARAAPASPRRAGLRPPVSLRAPAVRPQQAAARRVLIAHLHDPDRGPRYLTVERRGRGRDRAACPRRPSTPR
ncbi:hypothetical protein R6V09_08035 [Streptomyces sp. W16]|nr:hypothetical protein [Streptomyces sp. W16]MDV9170088.1 hypothetical protein [Streptomyces sp. W16]